VTPLSLGVEINGGMVDVLIPKNTTIPTEKKNTYTTAVANQTSVTIHVTQGERPLAKDNKSLGMFNLDGIAPAPAHVPQIQVSFDIDANGILSVNAKDMGTGKEQKITITQSGNLTSEEIEKMVKEAEEYAESDKATKDLILAKNELEMLISSLKTTCEESKDKVDESLITPVYDAIAEAEKVLPTGTKEDIEAVKDTLLKASHALSAKIYESQPQPQTDTNESVIDAEVVS
jgi:molecular chaperone DnaK